MSFAQFNLNTNIYKALSVCGYTTPTPVQSKAIPEIMSGRDVVVSAQTGTGKTAAFVLPALHKLSQNNPQKNPQILILTPTRELATQITKTSTLYGKFLKYRMVSLVGGMPYYHQIKDLNRGADILIATPGRLLDHMQQKRVNLSNINILVLDEADRMLDMGFIDDVNAIAKQIPSQYQTLLFSATIENKLMTQVRTLLKNPVRIDLSHDKVAAPKIHQEMIKADSPQHKTKLLKHFLNDANIYKAIVFSATKVNADKLAHQLRDDGFAAAALHGDLRQNVRLRTLEQLRKGKIQILVATDVAARGIDICDISHVINYDLPRFCEDYVHRIGRTGRAGKMGTAISFILPSDKKHVQRIERYTGQRIKLLNKDNSEEKQVVTDDHSHKPVRKPIIIVRKQNSEGKSKDFAHKKKKPFNKRKFAKKDDIVHLTSDTNKSAKKSGFKKRKFNNDRRSDKHHSTPSRDSVNY